VRGRQRPATPQPRLRHRLEGQANWIIQPGGEGALHSARRDFSDVAQGPADPIRHKQIAALLKASSLGLFTADAKVLCTPPVVISVMEP